MLKRLNTLYIVRGLPGSGKSTYASKLADQLGCDYFEADHFFMVDGVYTFDPMRLGEAHRLCFSAVKKAVQNGEDVIVSNTFTTIREVRKYVQLAHDFKYNIVLVHCTGKFGSIHDVPEYTMSAMRARWVSNSYIKKYFGNRYISKISRV